MLPYEKALMFKDCMRKNVISRCNSQVQSNTVALYFDDAKPFSHFVQLLAKADKAVHTANV